MQLWKKFVNDILPVFLPLANCHMLQIGGFPLCDAWLGHDHSNSTRWPFHTAGRTSKQNIKSTILSPQPGPSAQVIGAVPATAASPRMKPDSAPTWKTPVNHYSVQSTYTSKRTPLDMQEREKIEREREKTKTRPRLARKQNIASEVGPTLQDAFFFPTLREASARQHQARCSAQTGRCKLVCASCSTQVALCKLLCASCSAQVAPASWSLQVALCKLRSLQVALCKLLCASCSVQVALRKLLCASCSRQGALRKLVGASWSAQVALCNLLCASCSAQVAVKCKLHLATPARRPGRNQTREVPGAGARTTRQLPRTSSNNKSRKKLEFLHLDHADSRRGLREHRRNPSNSHFDVYFSISSKYLCKHGICLNTMFTTHTPSHFCNGVRTCRPQTHQILGELNLLEAKFDVAFKNIPLGWKLGP